MAPDSKMWRTLGRTGLSFFPNTPNAPVARSPAIFVLGPADFGSTGGGFKAPMDVAVDSARNIYVADQGNNPMLIFQSLIFPRFSAGLPPGWWASVGGWNVGELGIGGWVGDGGRGFMRRR